jgi:SNF2 family DNA or RNA helicase
MFHIELALENMKLNPKEKEPFPILYQHQKDALKFIKKRETDSQLPGGFLGMSMGLGKTLTMLTTIIEDKQTSIIKDNSNIIDEEKELIKEKIEENVVVHKDSTHKSRHHTTLVLAPKTALLTWEEEINKFYPNLNFMIFTKEKMKVESITRSMIENCDVVITNYEFIRGVAKRLKIFNKIAILSQTGSVIGANCHYKPLYQCTMGEGLLFSTKWYRIIADESHNFSNHTTSLFESMISLCGLKKWCLSGTPIRNSIKDLYAQYKFLGYQDKHFNFSNFKPDTLDKYIFFLDYEKANIKLPELYHFRVKCKLIKEQARVYRYFLDAAREAYGEFVLGTRNFSFVLIMFLRLRQACVAPYTIIPSRSKEEDKEETDFSYEEAQRLLDISLHGLSSWMHDKTSSSGIQASKVQKTAEIVENIPKGEKVVIFTMFKKVMNLIMEAIQLRMPDKKIIKIDGEVTKQYRSQALSNFKLEGFDVLIISYKIGSESLNLTHANHIILVEPWWCPAVIEQAKARVQRLGQNKNIYVYELMIDSIEGIPKVDTEDDQNKNLTMEQRMIIMCDYKTKEAKEFLSNTEGTKRGEGMSLNARQIGQLLG